MVQTIDPNRLRQVRNMRQLGREALAMRTAEKGERGTKAMQPLTAKTIYRLEKGDEAKPIRQATLGRLARALNVEPEVLTGDKPLPVELAQSPAPPDEAAYYQLPRVDGAVRNGFELVARRYGVSVSKIATLAPLLFVILAEASLKDQSKKAEQYWAKRDEFDTINSQLTQLEESIVFVSRDDEVHDIENSIAKNDLFGRSLWRTTPANWDRDNPFATYLQALAAGRDNIIKISAIGPKSTDYRVCRTEAVGLAGDEFAEALLNGEVPIHRMTREVEFGPVSERTEWMRQHKISVVKVEEEPLHDVPERPPVGLSLAIDIEL